MIHFFPMRFDILSIFPQMFDSYVNQSILKRAQHENKIEIFFHDIREYTISPHHRVDDSPYGGGAGMVMQVSPIYHALKKLNALKGCSPCSRTLVLSAGGNRFTQQHAREFAELERIVLVCGRYEGVDQRVADYCVDAELSIGEYVLTGGELGAMVVLDAVARLIPGVLLNSDSILEESFSLQHEVEYPQYTRPEIFQNDVGESWNVPEILMSGNHKRISEWRKSYGDKSSK